MSAPAGGYVKRTKTGTISVGVRWAPTLWGNIRDAAQEEGVTPSEWIRRAARSKIDQTALNRELAAIRNELLDMKERTRQRLLQLSSRIDRQLLLIARRLEK